MHLSEQNISAKFTLLTIIIVASLLLSMLVSIGTGLLFWDYGVNDLMNAYSNIEEPSALGFLKYSQIIQTCFLFIVPSFIFARLINKDGACYLNIDHKPSTRLIWLVVVSMLFAIPFVNYLGALNAQMQLPEFLSGLEDWMFEKEQTMKKLTTAFLNIETYPQLFLNLIMIAVLPAIGEELLFRGVLQRLFNDSLKNIHLSIIVTSILFSALHMQFYGFLPRFVLGMIFGYLYYWSSNLWYAIFAHFLNNGAAVLLYFKFGNEVMEMDADDIGLKKYAMIVPVLLAAVSVYFFRQFKQLNTEER